MSMKNVTPAFLLFAALTSPSVADTITMRADTWCPFNCEPGAADPGVFIEIAEFAFGKKGHKIEYKTLSWARTVAEVESGNINAAVAAGDIDVKDHKLVVGKEKTGISSNCLFAKSDSKAKYSGTKDLKQFKKIGAIQDYDYGEDVSAVFKANAGLADAVSGDDPVGTNIKKLKADRVDAIIEDESVMKYTLKKLNETGVKEIGCEPKVINLYMAFSPKNPKSAEYAKIMDEGVVELRKNGTLKKILAKYGVTNWK
jgi:polar amino acid transport system substrate-binding protein